MFIKSVKLQNIRSYEYVEINFPIGSVLLAGDIGSGKSTILLAIEFAIFGAKKGELPAYTLLRHGKKEGNVELRMQIDSKDVIVKRTLKRGNDDIKQEAGYVIVNGLKKEGTAEELRAIVLELLGYPKDLIKKGKDFIYRYTVYTPQEEMKQILYEDKETRLETLRKVFNIDKYRRISQNAGIIIKFLREKKRNLEGFILDLEYKKKELEERKNEIAAIEKKFYNIIPKINEVKNIINEKKKNFENIENDIRELNNLRKELSVSDATLGSCIEQNNNLNSEIKKLEKQIEDIKKDTESKKLDELGIIQIKINDKEKEIEEADNSHKSIIKKIRELEVKIEHCNDTIKKMQALEICPLCEQKVDETHKHDITSRENKKFEEFINQIKKSKDEEIMLEQIRIKLKKDIDHLIKEQTYCNILKIKFENLDEKLLEKEEKSSLKEKIREKIGMLNVKMHELNQKIQKYSDIEQQYKTIKKELDELSQQERFLEAEKRGYETEKEAIKRFVVNTEKEINEKEKAKIKLDYISQLVNWIDEFFVNLMSTMEKHVMVNIHSQFNELFKVWFDIIMEDETINVRVDEEFTPIIGQNGYETYIDNLSGGEKTSVALSYRLALNKVINDITAEIKTRDIIILDEPTDGFSSEQLDKVRDVLQQLNMKQIIIVSHESKIESFVENVIRIQKQEHVSTVI